MSSAPIDVDEKLIKSISYATSKAVESLPCLKDILHISASSNYIYGGFLRHIAEFYLEHKRAPDVDELLVYLDKSDVDIKIKTFNVANILRTIYYIIYNAGGTIEYFGNDYDATHKTVEEKFPIDDYCYEGLYSIWIPLKDTSIRYDLFISKTTAANYTCDFDVNSMTFSWTLVPHPLPDQNNKRILLEIKYHYVDEFQLSTQENVIRNIRDKKIVPYEKYLTEAMDPMKRIYRMKKLWDSGYRIGEHHKECFIDMFEHAFEMCHEQAVEILCNRIMKTPSIPRERGLIYMTKYRPDVIDFDRWYDDMYDILKECDIDVDSLTTWKKRKSDEVEC